MDSSSSVDLTRSASGLATAPLSPSLSPFSRVQSTRSSSSSLPMSSSPLPPRDSFDLYGSIKRLEDVREEPLEREEEHCSPEHGHLILDSRFSSPLANTPLLPEYSLGDNDAWSTTSSGHHQFKRQRPASSRNSITDRVTSRFGSISRRWKSRSAIGPQLSIVTSDVLQPRSVSAASSRVVSPSLSRMSQHEPQSPVFTGTATVDEQRRVSAATSPAAANRMLQDGEEIEVEDDVNHAQATTPLLPPMIADLSSNQTFPVQSPLQSPSIAATPCIGSSRPSVDSGAVYLPSPPLSSRPSMASIQRKNSALIVDIPPLTLSGASEDIWDTRLGHANYSIHPEPYVPDHIDLESYREFRANWDQARKSYAQHLARTSEHYGHTSRIYRLTEEKWDEIAGAWEVRDGIQSRTLSSLLNRLSDEVSGSPGSPHSFDVLDQPQTRIVIPPMDKSGKFPDIGDADIVGPLAVGPPRAAELTRKHLNTPPGSPKKRNFFKFLSDVLGRH